MIAGKVIKTMGAWCQVRSEDGQEYACQLRGKLRLQAIKTTAPVVIGDHVQLLPLATSGQGVIHEVLPRKNYLIRQAPHKKAYGQLLAANVDLACLIVPAVKAATQCLSIDRFLVVAEALGVRPGVVFNKLDLLDKAEQAALAALRKLYEVLGYETWALSALHEGQVATFGQALQGKVTLLSGPSGVGKSTLVNALAPAAHQRVGATVGMGQRGRHTTTHAALFEISPQTFIIDTPGIQSLVPYAVEKATIGHCFPEIRNLLAACQFYNCTHQHEPGCAVVQAVAQGTIAATRYENYLEIVRTSVS
ncbi:MAG: ribosome small subunit-dependent GTPase A [Bacteroidota bacterium]